MATRKRMLSGSLTMGGFTNVMDAIYYGCEAFEHRHAEILGTIFNGSSVKLAVSKLRFIRADVSNGM